MGILLRQSSSVWERIQDGTETHVCEGQSLVNRLVLGFSRQPL